jgi:hypothetical protein
VLLVVSVSGRWPPRRAVCYTIVCCKIAAKLHASPYHDITNLVQGMVLSESGVLYGGLLQYLCWLIVTVYLCTGDDLKQGQLAS